MAERSEVLSEVLTKTLSETLQPRPVPSPTNELHHQTLTVVRNERVMSFCTSDQAKEALDYLRQAFGGYTIPEQERRADLRLFMGYPLADVEAAIDDLVKQSTNRRPSPSDISQAIRARIRQVSEQKPARDSYGPVVPSEEVPAILAVIRECLPTKKWGGKR